MLLYILQKIVSSYIVTEYAGASLKYVLDRQKYEEVRLINFDHIKYIIYQLLRALKYLHSANVKNLFEVVFGI